LKGAAEPVAPAVPVDGSALAVPFVVEVVYKILLPVAVPVPVGPEVVLA